jgi:hypothetical protein
VCVCLSLSSSSSLLQPALHLTFSRFFYQLWCDS